MQTVGLHQQGPARASGQGCDRYFLLVVDNYTRYTTVFPFRNKGEVHDVLIPWIHAVHLQLCERSLQHPYTSSIFEGAWEDPGEEVEEQQEEKKAVVPHHEESPTAGSSPDSNTPAHDPQQWQQLMPQQLSKSPRSPMKRVTWKEKLHSLEQGEASPLHRTTCIARTSMIHAAAPHFLWPFAVRYAAHQLNLWPRVSLPEISPTLRWTGKVGDASVFQVWGSRAFVHYTSADKSSARAIPCVFLGFPLDTPCWQFYHPTSHRVFPSQDVTFDESDLFYRLFPYRSSPPPPPPLFLAPGPPPVAVASGAARGAASGGAEPGGAESEGVGSWGAVPGGAEPGGAEPVGAEPGGAEPEGAESGGAVPQGTTSSGGPAGALPRLSARPEPLSLQQSLRVLGTVPGGAGAGAGDTGAVDPGAGGAGTGGVVSGRSRSPLPAPSPYAEQIDSFTERREPEPRPASPVCAVCTDRQVPHPRPPLVPGTHTMELRPSSVPLRVPLPAPPESSLPAIPDPESDLARAASPTVSLLLATYVTDPSFESTAASALVAELVDFAAACRLDYANTLVAESESASPPSVGGECALCKDVLEDRQEDFECLAAAVPRFASMLLAPEGDPDAPLPAAS
ncbi:unnamed protein product [Closterium sp. NIES-54]